MKKKYMTYYPTRRMSNNMLIEQIIDRHIQQFLSEEYLRQDIRDIIYEERYILNEGAFSILKIAENWPKIVKGVSDIIDFCKGSTKFEKLKNAVTTVTSGNPFKVIKWFLGSKAEMQKKIKLMSEIEEKYARTKHAGEKMVCDVGGYAFDAAFASDFKTLANSLSLLKNLLLDVAGCFGPVGEGIAMLATAFESFLKDCVFGNERDFGTIAYNMADSIVLYEFNVSISQIYNKALEIGTAIKNVASTALGYILATGKGVVTVGNMVANAVSYGGETGRMLNNVQSELSELYSIVNTLSQGGKLDAFCRSGRDANGANKLKVYLTKFVNTKYPDYRDQDAVNAGANRAKGDGTMAKVWCDRIEDSTGIMVLKDNQLHPYWADVYERAKFIKKCNYDLNKWISALAWDFVNKQNITDPNQREALHVAVEVRYNEYIVNGDYTHYGQNYQYSYYPTRQPKKGQKVQQKLPPVEHFGGQNFGIM